MLLDQMQGNKALALCHVANPCMSFLYQAGKTMVYKLVLIIEVEGEGRKKEHSSGVLESVSKLPG